MTLRLANPAYPEDPAPERWSGRHDPQARAPRVPPRVLHRDDGAGDMILRFADPAYAPGSCTAIGAMERAA